MSIAAVLIVAIFMIVIATAGFVILKLAYSPGNLQPAYPAAQVPGPPASPTAQEEKKPARARSENSSDRTRKKDMRDAPLPRCPKCGNAIAYMEEKCSKCGTAIDPPARKARTLSDCL
jgi:hypothetical protein